MPVPNTKDEDAPDEQEITDISGGQEGGEL